MPESFRFMTPFRNQRLHGSQTLMNSAWPYFYPNFTLIKKKVNQKTSVLVRSDILGLLGNTLTADHMNSPHNTVKSVQQLQTPLSPKPKISSQFLFSFIFFCISQIYIKFRAFSKKYQLCSSNSFEVILSKKCGYLNARKLPFHNSLQESTCSRVPNTDEFSIVPRLS